MGRPSRSDFILRDKRTHKARRFHTLRASFAGLLTAAPTGTQDALLTQAATFALLAEQETAKIVAGDPEADPGMFTHYSNRYLALLARLGAEPEKMQPASEADGIDNSSTTEPGNLIAAILSTRGQ